MIYYTITLLYDKIYDHYMVYYDKICCYLRKIIIPSIGNLLKVEAT